MKIGAIVICRYNSSRLPGKILKEINGKPLLNYILERLDGVVGLDDVIIATSNKETDDPIVEYCDKNNLKYYRGDLNNVAERFLKCAQHFNLDYAIRINGDNLFVDSKVISEMIDVARKGSYDLISNVKDRTFPKGISVEIVKTAFYNKSYLKFDSDYYKEHVTIYFYENEDSGNFYFHINTTCPSTQLAIY